MKKYLSLLCSLLLLGGLWSFQQADDGLVESTPLYIHDISLYRQQLLTAERGTRQVALYSLDGSRRIQAWNTAETPTGAVGYGQSLLVTTSDERGGVERISTDGSSPTVFIPTGRGACSPVIDSLRQRLYVCNQFQNTVSEINLNTNRVEREVQLLREPKRAVLSQDGKYLFVANFLPVGRADREEVAASISVIDLATFRRIRDIQLATGSNAIRGLALTPDGKYLLATHNLGRFQVPTSQLQQGWMNTSAVSLINTRTFEYGGAVLLDEADRGAAGVWSVACTPQYLVTTHSGTHEISLIDYAEFIKKYEQVADKSTLSYDLRFLVGLRRRIPLTGNGPRSFAVHGNRLYIPTFFSDTLNMVPLDKPDGRTAAALVRHRKESKVDKGEKYFNDATYCFQNWQSCNGCHPGDARTDGLNWDNLNDGIGNPKNCKSMLYAHRTPPSMISGIRENAVRAVRTGFKYIQFNEVSEEVATCVDEYLMSLKPVPSPWLVNGALSEKARRGKKVFERLHCAHCHNGPLYTDLKMYVIGEDVEFEKGWDTPTLKEVWRTAPYLFDGRAATMQEVFDVHKHGIKGKKVSPQEIEELVEYVNSL